MFLCSFFFWQIIKNCLISMNMLLLQQQQLECPTIFFVFAFQQRREIEFVQLLKWYRIDNSEHDEVAICLFVKVKINYMKADDGICTEPFMHTVLNPQIKQWAWAHLLRLQNSINCAFHWVDHKVFSGILCFFFCNGSCLCYSFYQCAHDIFTRHQRTTDIKYTFALSAFPHRHLTIYSLLF